MNQLNEKKRLLDVLSGRLVDRPPVICPGGMMNAAVTEVLQGLEGNHNVESHLMVEVAKRVHDLTGFENYGVPFCMTAEAEPLGVEVHFGSQLVEPRVTAYSQEPMEDLLKRPQIIPWQEERMACVLEAIGQLKNDRIPVIGNITGHMSTATSVIDPYVMFKDLVKKPDTSYDFLDYINTYLIDYAIEMIKAGADVIAISDPTATGEILGGRLFKAYALPFYQKFVEALKPYKTPVIFHICGKSSKIIKILDQAGFTALSFDSCVNMAETKRLIGAKLMGNVSTQTLNFEPGSRIEVLTKHSLKAGVDIVAPACGLGMSTPLESIRTMTQYVKAYGGQDQNED